MLCIVYCYHIFFNFLIVGTCCAEPRERRGGGRHQPSKTWTGKACSIFS
jgi:hypothetical protein